MWESRVAPLSGVLFGVLLLGSFLVNPNTDFVPPAEEALAFFQAGPRRALVSAYLTLLSAAALIWFAASLFGWLRDHDDDGGRRAVLATSGGVLAATMLVVSGWQQWRRLIGCGSTAPSTQERPPHCMTSRASPLGQRRPSDLAFSSELPAS